MKRSMKISIGILTVLLVVSAFLLFKWLSTGNQRIRINTPANVYSNSVLPVQVLVEDINYSYSLEQRLNEVPFKSEVKLLDGDGREVNNIKKSYESDIASLELPDLKEGYYILKTIVSSKLGTDTVEKSIYIKNKEFENIVISFDKGIYKPGDTVRFRALILKKDENTPRDSEDVNIIIKDGNQNKVYNKTIKTSEYGIVSDSFKLADELNSGTYELSVATPYKSKNDTFIVNPYVAPKYEVKIETDKENYLVGDTANIKVNAMYFFGEAVKSANVKLFINDKEISSKKTNNQGDVSFTYRINYERAYNIKVEVVDSSNYFIEKTSKFFAGKDKFKIELYPEFGSLVEGTKNNIYVISKSVYDEPLKTYITASEGSFKKQVVTDENGIGNFSIDINSGTLNSKTIRIEAENMSGDKISKDFTFDVTNKSYLFKTDKVKYKQGDSINIEVLSESETNRLYFCKGEKVLKTITTNTSETTVSLDKEYGLIDIYIQNPNDSYNAFPFRKTIFIIPSKNLSIKIDADKEEYKPGEEIKLKFDVQDEEANKKDSALLVSMIDNSILALADNDLSIDNIKLALQESDANYDLASLYSAIINDKDDALLTTLLYRQGNNNLNISTYSYRNNEKKEKYQFAFITSIVLFLVLLVTVIFAKLGKLKVLSQGICNYLTIFLMCMLLYSLICSIHYYWDIELLGCIIIAILTLAIYAVLISDNIKEIMAPTSRRFIITLVILAIAVLLYEIFTLQPTFFVCGFFAILLLTFFITKIEGIKDRTIVKKISIEIAGYIKFLLISIISLVICIIVLIGMMMLANWFRYYSPEYEAIEMISAFLLVVGFAGLMYFGNYSFNKMIIQDDMNQGTKTSNVVITICAIAGILIVLVVMSFLVLLYNRASDVVMTSVDSIDFIGDRVYESSAGISAPSLSINNSPSFRVEEYRKDSSVNEVQSIHSNEDSYTQSTNTQESTEKVRSLFLESMCFVPELIAKNGNAELNFNLSDNITTWTIQAVGNTKDGRIGYGSNNNIKVFQEFFADFELPANLVVGDKIKVPVTVYNYTNQDLEVDIKVIANENFSISGSNNQKLKVMSNETSMIYIPIEIKKTGEFKFRVESRSDSYEDIIEKTFEASFNGLKVEKVVTSGVLDQDINDDILLLDKYIEGSGKIKVKIYPNTISQTVDGIENIFKMPTGCFEQVSSSLYPDIVALQYLYNSKIENKELEKKALEYISSGYQKLLKYEVGFRSGGFSLYGESPAETVLTAYGLMEFVDLSSVYNIDSDLINRTKNFLYSKQKSDGLFEITGYHVGGAGSRENIALNAYITWALSEADPKDSRLTKSVEALKSRMSNIDDNYTLGLIACALANVGDNTAKSVAEKIMNGLKEEENNSYVTSSIRDYYGSCGRIQDNQATALLSMALSKLNIEQITNAKLINYLISNKDNFGTWYSTQNTILCLKAINSFKLNQNFPEQTIKVSLNSETKEVEVTKDQIDYILVTFDNVGKENKLTIDLESGEALYMVTEEHYIPYENVDASKNDIELSVKGELNTTVNGVIEPTIQVINNSSSEIYNGMVVVNIPQGFVVLEESLQKLQSQGAIEKYEMNYRTINIYLRNFDARNIVTLPIGFRASYPVDVIGLSARAYDYYNPDVEGFLLPQRIVVN